MPESPSKLDNAGNENGDSNIPPKNTIQTGIDLYFKILKRQRSPTSTNHVPEPKLQKTQNPISSNYYSILASEDNAEVPNKPLKEQKPPPIYVREQNNNLLVDNIAALIGSNTFHVVSMLKGDVHETKVQVYSETNFRKVTNNFDEKKKNYYTYQLKSAKGLSVVIKGIESSVPTSEIKDALQSEGYEVKSIVNVINKNKIPQPLFRVEIAFDKHMIKKNEPHPIYSKRYLLHRKITVEQPHKRKDPVQCQNCQEYGHTKTYCKLPAVCVICGDSHKTLECKGPKDDPKIKKCSNCGANHTANFRGCPIFVYMKQRPPQRTNGSYAANVALPRAQFPSSNPANFNKTTNHSSYSQVLKEVPEPLQNSSLEGSIKVLVDSMHTFMDRMTSMMQEMMRNQSILIQTLAQK